VSVVYFYCKLARSQKMLESACLLPKSTIVQAYQQQTLSCLSLWCNAGWLGQALSSHDTPTYKLPIYHAVSGLLLWHCYACKWQLYLHVSRLAVSTVCPGLYVQSITPEVCS